MTGVATAIIGLVVGALILGAVWHNIALRYLWILFMFAAFMSRFEWWRHLFGH